MPLRSAGQKAKRTDRSYAPDTRARVRAAHWVAALIALATATATTAIAAEPVASPRHRNAQRQFWEQLGPPADYEHEWFESQFATGGWGGMRARLSQLGITPTLSYVSDILGNPTGGRSQGVRYFHNLGLDVTFDLAKLVNLPGARIHISASSRSGRDLSADVVDNVFTVAQVCCGATVRVVNVAYEQSLFDDKLDLAIGRLAAGDDFLSSPLYFLFVNSGINGNPSGITFNVPFTAYPVATWGARAQALPIEWLSVMFGVYNGDPDLGRNRAHGLDWNWHDGVGVLLMGEIGLQHAQTIAGKELPGNLKLGGYYHTGPFDDLRRDRNGDSFALTGLPPAEEHGNGGMYVLVDQMLYREDGPGPAQGLTPFVSLLFAPDDSLSQMPFFANGGLVYSGIIPGRDADSAVLGAVYGEFSSELRRSQRDLGSTGVTDQPVQDYELVLELGYFAQVTPWLTLQPDVQYIVNPGAGHSHRDALVLGAQIALIL